MSKDPSIEHDLERAIKAGLRERSRTASCPPMDVVAAYCEHSLASEELSQWEAHFAGCRRCQQLLAAMARVEPSVAPAAAPSWWSRALDWRWLVPAAAAASAFAIWIAVRPGTRPAESPTVIVASRPETQAAPTAAAQPEPSSALRMLEKAQEQFAKKTEPNPAESAQAMRDAIDRLAKKEAPTVAAEAAGAVAGKPAASPPAPAVAPAPRTLASRVDAAAADAAMGRQAGLVVIAPGAQVQWRAGPGGQIEQSRDAGATWDAQNAGTSEDLLAGSAPSDSVCWIVGRGGTILRSTDGRAWSRLESPVSADLVSVAATDAANATIAAVDGQRFMTRDGGGTWEKREH
ncbi:MAG: hypothetical protein HYS05_04820 [Acidobacteria bacterium]|nr:hypothetical protein [Acidobacteriota bacterium]